MTVELRHILDRLQPIHAGEIVTWSDVVPPRAALRAVVESCALVADGSDPAVAGFAAALLTDIVQELNIEEAS